MNTLSIFLSIFLVILAGAIVYFQYFFKEKATRDVRILGSLRFVSLLGVLLLLVNPKFERKITETHKPKLLLGVDNSASILHAASDQEVSKLKDRLSKDSELQTRFDRSTFLFGPGLKSDTTLNFSEQQTNIYQAIEDLDALGQQQNAAIVLLTDGLQTFGRSYAYKSTKNPVYPIVFGDTIDQVDIQIGRINVNAYTTKDNNFPVEVFLNANVSDDVRTELIVEKNGQELYSSEVIFTGKEPSKEITFYLPADSIGMQLYKAKLLPILGETDLRNNNQSFGIEVLDEQTEVAVVYSVLHPDLGMIKRAIEANKQRKASLIQIDEFKSGDQPYTLYVLYQPNALFSKVYEEIQKREKNYFLITGTHTDWNFLNKVQNQLSKVVTGDSERYFPAYQNDFNTFYTEDIGFESFPPLTGQFGTVEFNSDHEVMIHQEINGVRTEMPLLAAFGDDENKRIVLFGEDIWKWRIQSYELFDSFQSFDQFFNSLVQYLQLSDIDKAMDLYYKPVYHAQEPIIIQAKNYDSNLNVELNSKLVLSVNGSREEIPFYVKNNYYEARMNSLEEGTYRFEVKDLDADKIQRGSFIIESFTLEEGSTQPNIKDLGLLAHNSGGALFYQDQFDEIKNKLLTNPDLKPTQIERNKMISLIDWRWLLGLIVLSLSLEWLLRKYRGMI